MAIHYFRLKKRAITYAEESRAKGYIAVITATKTGYSVYVYRKEKSN